MLEVNQNGRKRGEQLVELIYKSYEERHKPRQSRRLGPSWLGLECERQILYKFRWCAEPEKVEGRVLRLFETGHLEEERFVKDIKSTGATIVNTNPDDASKQISAQALNGHLAAYLDSMGRFLPKAPYPDEWTVVEMKTWNDRDFKKLKKKGLTLEKNEHVVQMQIYMRLVNSKQALYIAKNKNTDELYCEYFLADKKQQDRLFEKGDRVVHANTLPPRISNKETFYKCSFCDYQKICHAGELPLRNCRTCVQAKPIDDGKWFCQLHEKTITWEEQEKGCHKHLFAPMFIDGDQIDCDLAANTITYKKANEKVWVDDGCTEI